MSSAALSSPFAIGPVAVRNRAVLAPMSGVTDLPFRKLAARFGAGLVVTEMIAGRELVMNARESWSRLKRAGLDPHMVQLAGRDAQWLAEAAKIAADNGAAVIDINMGCPAKKVIGGYAGSALMREPDHALSLIEAVVAAVDVPITVKMRLGWDADSINAPIIAARAEAAGVAMVTVHGRTRMQFYEGRADWDAIAAVRAAVSIPLIANGDVASEADALTILARCGADAVMVGRAAQGQPWLIGRLAGWPAPPRSTIAGIVAEHYEGMLAHYGQAVGTRHARKHLGWYLDRHAPNAEPRLKAAIMTSVEPEFVRRAMAEALDAATAAAAAEREAA